MSILTPEYEVKGVLERSRTFQVVQRESQSELQKPNPELGHGVGTIDS